MMDYLKAIIKINNPAVHKMRFMLIITMLIINRGFFNKLILCKKTTIILSKINFFVNLLLICKVCVNT